MFALCQTCLLYWAEGFVKNWIKYTLPWNTVYHYPNNAYISFRTWCSLSRIHLLALLPIIPCSSNPHCQTRHVDMFFFILHSPLTVCPAGFCVIFSPWELNLGGGAVVSDSNYRPHRSKPWEETCCTAGYRKTADRRLVFKIHAVDWCSAGKRGNQCNQWAKECCTQREGKKIYFGCKRLKVVFFNLSSELNCCMKKVLSNLNLLPELVLRSLSDGSQADGLWTLLISFWSKALLSVSFFCFSVISGGRKTAPLWVIRDGRNPLEPAF